MAKKKKKSKLKKLAKVLGAGLAIAGLGRAFANRNASPSTNADAIKAMTSNDAYSDDTMPSNLSKDMGMKRTRRDKVAANVLKLRVLKWIQNLNIISFIFSSLLFVVCTTSTHSY